MDEITKPQSYRDLIDRLVHVLRNGQGQMGAIRVRQGLWNQNATPDCFPDQHAINDLLARLSREDRETIALMLEDQVAAGMFEALKALETFQVPPFESGYEGSPYEDFIGRLYGDWEWPE
jgi:hypothetical protein